MKYWESGGISANYSVRTPPMLTTLAIDFQPYIFYVYTTNFVYTMVVVVFPFRGSMFDYRGFSSELSFGTPSEM